MKILFLGYDNCKLLSFLKSKYDTFQTSSKIKLQEVVEFDWIISFGYKHIITEDIINHFKSNIVNLHISYLPYNRGMHPNFWSFRDGTPKGVTIHQIDKGLDTGDIVLQKEVIFKKEQDTLKSTYEVLIEEIQNLFIENYKAIFNKTIKTYPQVGQGTFHYGKEIEKYKDLLTENWNTKIIKIMSKRTDLEIIEEVQQIRSKNNVNWMDILRLAFKHAPDEARELMGRVNDYDGKISSLLKELSENKD